MSEVKQERIVILSKVRGPKGEQQFFQDIQDAFDNGYRIADNNRREDMSMRLFRGIMGKCVMYLEGKEKEALPTIKREVEEPTAPEVVVKEDNEITEAAKGANEVEKETPKQEDPIEKGEPEKEAPKTKKSKTKK